MHAAQYGGIRYVLDLFGGKYENLVLLTEKQTNGAKFIGSTGQQSGSKNLFVYFIVKSYNFLKARLKYFH